MKEVVFENVLSPEAEKLVEQLKETIKQRVETLIDGGATMTGIRADQLVTFLNKQLAEVYAREVKPTMIIRDAKSKYF